MSQSKIAVIGAGVIGRACAVNFAEAGWAVDLFDPDQHFQHASWGNAGHLAVEQTAPLASLENIKSMIPQILMRRDGPVGLPLAAMNAWLPFSLRLLFASRPDKFRLGKAVLESWLAEAIPSWRKILHSIGHEELLRDEGHNLAWENADTSVSGIESWRRLSAPTSEFRDTSQKETEEIDQLFANSLEKMIHFTKTAQITSLSDLREAQDKFFKNKSVQLVLERVECLHPKEEGIEIWLSSGNVKVVDKAVIAAGTASKNLLKGYNFNIPIISERGYHLDIIDPDWPESVAPTVFPERSVIVTRFRQSLRIAGFVEFAHPDTPPDPRKWEKLERHARELGLPMTGEVNKWMGARPTLPDYLPAIGLVPEDRRIAYAFGHHHLGLTLSAITADAVTAMLNDDAFALDLVPLSLARF